MSFNISLPEELENKIYEKVRTGCYPSPNEVVIEALTDFFSKPTEDQVLSYFVKKRLQEIEDSGEGNFSFR